MMLHPRLENVSMVLMWTNGNNSPFGGGACIAGGGGQISTTHIPSIHK